jgi:hypothetical protein
MTPGRGPGQSIAIFSVPNLHDLGGWPTRDGSKGAQRAFRAGFVESV